MWADPWKEGPDLYAKRLTIGPDQTAVLPFQERVTGSDPVRATDPRRHWRSTRCAAVSGVSCVREMLKSDAQ